MELSLQKVIPLPLVEKVNTNGSGIWNGTITFKKGEFIFIQAPSGTGKTTLVHVLYHLRKDYKGAVLWDNKNIASMNGEAIAALRTKGVSIIFQDMRLFPELTAWENLEIKRQLTNTVTEAQVANWMERLGLIDKRDSLAAILSYGEQQRVAIIRALLQPFDWLLMDEPFSHLDHSNTARAIALIREVVLANNAGMIMADLDDNNYFPYTKKILL